MLPVRNPFGLDFTQGIPNFDGFRYSFDAIDAI